MRTPQGWKPIEQLAVGDLVLSRADDDPTGPVEARVVEEVFVRTGWTLELTVAGRLIETTPEHPFWVRERGWVEASALAAGDELALLTEGWSRVDSVRSLGTAQRVYNCRVAEWHTYFVGGEDWGFSVWAHNTDCALAGDAKTYQSYTKKNPTTGEVYSGRTSGTGTPAQNISRRDSSHHMTEKGFGPAQLESSSANAAAIRGREQQLIELNGGAKSQGGTSGNQDNGISARNRKRQFYLDEAEKEFGS